KSASNPDRALVAADRLYGEGHYAEAAKAYQEVLAAAPRDWPRYPRVVESLMFSFSSTDQNEACIKLVREAWPRLGKTSSACNLAASGLDSAVPLPDSAPQRGECIAEFERRAREVLADSSTPAAADDRSGVYISLLDARQNAKDDAGAHQVAEAWAAFLEGEAAKAKTPDERVVF